MDLLRKGPHGVSRILSNRRIPISGYVLSHSAAVVADAFDLSGTVIGATVLSFATTLPEKFVAITSSAQGHSGIVVASTAGRNIFLLTLCLALTLLSQPTGWSSRYDMIMHRIRRNISHFVRDLLRRLYGC